MPSNRLSDLAAGRHLANWLILGPFVLKTSDHFEREYMYERDHILDVDYLEADGGEAVIVPAEGQSHPNIGLGPKRLAWRAHPEADLYGTRIAGDIIYETVQRNCVIYAAAEVDAEDTCPALIDVHHPGMKVWVNGKLAANMPYGLTKGVRLSAPSIPIQLRKGANRILIKFRPGYICDGIDFTVKNVTVSPLTSRRGLPIALGRVRALPYFTGTPKEPCQVIEVALLNTSNVADTVRVTASSKTLGAKDTTEVLCEPHKVTSVRLALATPRKQAGKPVQVRLTARLFGKTIETSLEYEAGRAPKYDGTNYVLSSFHFDTTYHEEQRVYAMGAFDIVREYCALHRADPLFRSVISEVDYLKPYFDVYPEDRETLLQVFREKRSEPDVMYNQPNEQNCGGEALVRNFLYGQLIHEHLFGALCRVYNPGDVFGHPNQLSQIARKSGCIACAWGKHIFNFPPFFSHLALDGSSLPHRRGNASEEAVHAMGLSVRSDGIDQTPPTDWHAGLMPAYKQGTYGDLMQAIQDECVEKDAHLPVTSRDMSLYHAATALSRVNLKMANRLGETALIDAEKFATIANLMGAKYPEKALDKAWRQLLCGQHHDSITGTHNEISYIDLMNSYREALELGVDVLERSLDFIGRAIDPCDDPDNRYVVFNSLAWERTDVVRLRVCNPNLQGDGFALHDHKGRAVSFEILKEHRNRKGALEEAEIEFVAKKLPSLGYRAYVVVPADTKPPARERRGGNVIENEFYRIEVDPARGGGMVSVYDKKAQREVLDSARHPGNELAFLEEVADRAETQHEFYTTGLKMFSGDQPAAIEVGKGPVSTTLRARYSMGEICDVVQEITLYKGVQRIEFRTILLDVQREDYLYCVTFPTNLKGLAPVFDERFGAVARNGSKNYLDFRTHQMLMFSDCAVYAANKWMEYGNCATLRMGRNAYPISMVGLISTKDKAAVRIAEGMQQVLVANSVTCTPWFDADGPRWGSYLDRMDDDLLYTRFRISIGARGKNAYTRKLLDAQPGRVRAAFEKRLAKNGYAYLFVKDDALDDSSWPALPVLVIEAASNKDLAKAVDALWGDFALSGAIKLPAAVNAVPGSHTIDDYGVAMLNRGTYANSVEKDGVLCMMLAHTCRWYGGTNNFPEGYLVPENKNHVFTYALYPHAGDWREANTPRAAHEYNHPLLARRPGALAKPFLPAEAPFVEIEKENVILAAMKPYGNPMAAFEKNRKPDALAGITMRLYETTGRPCCTTIRFGKGMRSAWTANLLEQRERNLDVFWDESGECTHLVVNPFAIETVGLEPRKLGRRMYAKAIGAEAEPVQPVWVRSWEHDAESMPMGYAAVVCSISREVEEQDDGRTLLVKVNAVNDYTDAPISGEAYLLLPKGWSAEPALVPFALDPLGHATTVVTVHRPDPSAGGQIKLRHEYDGQTFQDVLEVGGACELAMDTENRGAAIVVTLHNPTREVIEAEVSMVTPIETWPQALVGELATNEITPRTRGVSVEPGDTVQLRYDVKTLAPSSLVPTDSYWAVAKLMSNGRIRLKRCDNRPETRRMWSNKWRVQYREQRNRPGKHEFIEEMFDG
ncbi:MAG: hypothetical protein GWP08_04925 [Nitrospiraceae bacterium]|nr:hypothetical protein [Nitrospiraceae bacterium]